MGLRACPLCFCQRAFVMSAAAVLAFGMFMPGVPTAAVTVLALAPAAAGFGIAAHHTYLVATGFLLCPPGVSGYFSAPAESLMMFVFLLVFLLGDLFHRKKYVMQGLGAVLLGYVFYTTCFKGTPEMTYNPNAPTDGCRVEQDG